MAMHGDEGRDDIPYVMSGLGLGLLAFLILAILLSAPIGSRYVLASAYLVLFASSTAALHLILVVAPKVNGKGISAKTPKYLEYAYIFSISISLAQILLSSPKSLEYFSEDEGMLLENIRRDAATNLIRCREHLSDTGNIGAFYLYTPGYCDKLEKIAKASPNNIADIVTRDIASDYSFMSYVIGMVQSDINRPLQPVHSNIPPQINRVLALRGLRADAAETKRDPFGWVIIVLLPLGIALRITKTSLELFGKLTPGKT